jgi:hypothetical protein
MSPAKQQQQKYDQPVDCIFNFIETFLANKVLCFAPKI